MNEKPNNKPDWNDLLALIGLLLLCVGIWWLSPPWALILGGTVILTIGVARSRS
ncbi:MAG: hypothetical protein ACQEXQ_16395 [Bacillota bacterium]